MNALHTLTARLLATAPVDAAGPSVEQFLLLLAVILVAAKVLGELAERIGQPAVVGELLAGVILGPSVLGFVDPAMPSLHAPPCAGPRTPAVRRTRPGRAPQASPVPGSR